MKKGRKGEILSSLENASIILLHDPLLSSIRYDLFSGRYEADHLPWNRHTTQWTKLDWSNLRCYMEKAYGFFGGIETAFYAVIPSQKYYHSVQDYICLLYTSHDEGGVPDVPLHLVGRAGGFLDMELSPLVAGDSRSIGTPDFTFYRQRG